MGMEFSRSNRILDPAFDVDRILKIEFFSTSLQEIEIVLKNRPRNRQDVEIFVQILCKTADRILDVDFLRLLRAQEIENVDTIDKGRLIHIDFLSESSLDRQFLE